ncbi:hypothetical protein [Stieleria neptunia]|nr:hypothetical protein [Stieleria neptunia]
MSEYAHVEKRFLDQLAALDWDVIDQGPASRRIPRQAVAPVFA